MSCRILSSIADMVHVVGARAALLCNVLHDHKAAKPATRCSSNMECSMWSALCFKPDIFNDLEACPGAFHTSSSPCAGLGESSIMVVVCDLAKSIGSVMLCVMLLIARGGSPWQRSARSVQ
jgi:hypothetical protein